jgi:hypothetical protein
MGALPGCGGEKGRAGVLGRNRIGEEIPLFFSFFFSKFSKAILQKILKFYLSFQMEHTIQNIMQQHECSIM